MPQAGSVCFYCIQSGRFSGYGLYFSHILLLIISEFPPRLCIATLQKIYNLQKYIYHAGIMLFPCHSALLIVKLVQSSI